MTTILAAIDFSAVTSQVIAVAAELARDGHAVVVLLNVTTPQTLVRDYAALETAVTALRRPGRGRPRRANRARISGVCLQVVGEPVPAILEQARLCAAEYLVIGSHGHGSMYELTVGSTTAGVIQGATCPVLVVPSARTRDARRRRRPQRNRDVADWLRRLERREIRSPHRGVRASRAGTSVPTVTAAKRHSATGTAGAKFRGTKAKNCGA